LPLDTLKIVKKMLRKNKFTFHTFIFTTFIPIKGACAIPLNVGEKILILAPFPPKNYHAILLVYSEYLFFLLNTRHIHTNV